MDPSLQGNLTGPGGPPAQPPPSSRFSLWLLSCQADASSRWGALPRDVRMQVARDRLEAGVWRRPPWGGGRHRVAPAAGQQRLLRSGEGRLRHQQSQALPLSPWVLISSLFSQLASLSSL